MGETANLTTGAGGNVGSGYQTGYSGAVVYDDITEKELNADDATDETSPEIEAARAQIEQTRAEMSDTINAIKDKLSPHNLVAEAQEAVAEKAREKVEDIKDAVKEKVADVAHGASEIAHNVASAVSNATDSLKEKAKEVFGGGSHSSDTAAITNSGDYTVASVTTESAVSRNAKIAGDILMQTVKENPIPAVLAGVGLGWLLVDAFMKQQQRAHHPLTSEANRYRSEVYTDSGYGAASGASYGAYQSNNFATAGNQPVNNDSGVQHKLHEAGEKVSDVVHSATDALGNAKDKAADVLHSAKDKAADALSGAKEKVSDTAHVVQRKAGEFGHVAQNTAHTAVSGTQHFIEENPLAAATVALLVGAIIGLTLPATEPENRYLGEHRDRLADQANEAAKGVLDKVQNVAGEAMNTAKSSLSEVKDNIKDTVQTQAREQGLVAA